MSYTKAQLTVPQREDANGNPASGYTISSYIWDTSTPTPMYTSSAGAGSATSFTLNSLGEPQTAGGTACDIFLDTSVTYKIIIRDAGGVQVGPTIGPVKPSDGTASTITFLQSGTGAVERDANSKMREIVSVDDYYNVSTDGADYGNAVRRAIAYIDGLGGGKLTFTAGKTYFLDSQINVCSNLTVWAYGAKITVGSTYKGMNKALFKNYTGTEFTSIGTRTATENVSFYGLRVDGQDAGVNGSTVANANYHGQIIGIGGWDAGSGVEGLVVKDCDFYSFAGTGVMVWHSSDVDISDNKFKNFFANTSLSQGSPIACYTVDGLIIENNRINHTAAGLSWHGIVVLDWNSVSSKNVGISCNVIRNLNGGDGISCEGNSVDNLDIATITGNKIYNCAGDGIGVDRCIEVTVTDNVIRTVGQIGIQATNTQVLIAEGNNINGCVGSGVFSSTVTVKAIVNGNRVQEVTYLNASYQGHGIFIEQGAPVDTSASVEIIGNYVKDVDGVGIYYASYGFHNADSNYVFNAGRSASATNRDGIITAAGTTGAGITSNNVVVSAGNTRYGFNSAGSNLPNLHGNKFYGTFTSNKIRVGFRAGISCNFGLDYNNVEYDYTTNIMKFDSSATPASGRFFVGDTLEYTAPAAGGYKGEVCTTAGVIGAGAVFKTWGAITP